MTTIAATLTTTARVWPALLAGGFAVVIWGATPAATEFAVAEIDPIAAGVLRTVFAATVTLPLVLILRLPLPRDIAGWGLLAAAAFGGFASFTLLFTHGLSLTSTAHAALILAGLPLITGLFGAAFDRRWPARIWFVGMAVALAGEVILVGVRDASGEASLEGDLYCAAASVFSGLGYVTGSRLAPRLGPMGSWSVTFWAISLAGLAQLTLVWWLRNSTDWAAVSAIGWSAVGYLALFSAIIGYVCWYRALSEGGVQRIAPLQFAQPLVSLILAVALFSEPLTTPLIAAAVLILVGIAITRRA